MGSIALVIGAIASSVAVATHWLRPTWERRVLAGAILCLVVAAAHLTVLLVNQDTSYVLVVDHTRPGLDVARRIMGLWGGSAGSLLLFTIIVGATLVLAPLRPPMSLARAVSVSALAWAGVLITTPFERLDNPAIRGSGLSPILEHWAMLVHPPLLYLGLALALVPAGVDATMRARWTVAAIGVLTTALALGGGWAYVELGWGGWWAWDPVENAALLPWLLLVGALHLPRTHPLAHWTLLTIWPAVFAGAAMTRTSLRTSVHAFANSEALGWFLWPLTVVVAVIALAHGRRSRTETTQRIGWRAALPAFIVLSTALIVAAGTFRPFLPGDATAGTFFARNLFPFTLVGVVALGIAPRIGRTSPARLIGEATTGAIFGICSAAWVGWTTWWQLALAAALAVGLVTTLGGQFDPRRTIAHLAMLCIIAGALGGTASSTQTFSLALDESVDVDGSTIVNRGVELDAGVQPVLTARVEVDGVLLTPALTVYPERGLRLPEVATLRRPHQDVQVILRSADDAETVTITVNVEPLTQLVWLGSGLLVLAMAFSARTRPGTPDESRSALTPTTSRDETGATR